MPIKVRELTHNEFMCLLADMRACHSGIWEAAYYRSFEKAYRGMCNSKEQKYILWFLQGLNLRSEISKLYGRVPFSGTGTVKKRAKYLLELWPVVMARACRSFYRRKLQRRHASIVIS